MRRPTVIIVALMLIISMIAIAQAVYSRDLYTKINDIWQSYSETPAKKSELFGDLAAEIGYTGFVHNFKNYVLRGDPAYGKGARENFERARQHMEAYRSLPLSERERAALEIIEGTLDQYAAQLGKADALIRQGASPTVIDQQVRIDDRPAASALKNLSNEIRGANLKGQTDLAQRIAAAEEISNIQIVVIAISFMASAVVAFWLLKTASDRRRLRRNLEFSERRFQDFASASSDWFWEMDSDLRFTFISENFFTITGIAAKDLIGKTRAESGLDPNDPRVKSNIEDLKAHRMFRGFRHSRVRPDGQVVHLINAGVPVYAEDGAFAGYRGAGSDITSLVSAEERFELSFEHDAVANVIIDETGGIQSVNSATLTMFGFTRDELVGQNVSILMPEAFARDHDQYIKNYLDTGVAKIIGVSRELTARRKSGEEFPIHLGIGVFVSDGVKCFIGSIQELSALKDSQLRLESALDEADRANGIKSQFLANMSHELRTPLNAIVGFSEMMSLGMLGDKDTKPYVEYAENILGSARHLLELVNEILDLSQIEAGGRKLNLETVSTQEIIRNALMITQRLAIERNVTVEISVSPDNLMITVDPRAIRQILVNLLSNAIKYSLTDGIVSLDVSRGAERIQLSFSDDGVGIPADKLSQITSRFTRAVDDPYTSNDGWGFGLAITKSLVEAHGGALTVKSTVGVGTMVQVLLPIFADDSIDDDYFVGSTEDHSNGTGCYS